MDEFVLNTYLDEFKNENLTNFSDFYDRTKKSIFYNILSFVKSHEVAEDLLQETYVKFLNNIHSINKGKTILGYLMMISKNCSLDYLRKISKENLSLDDEENNLEVKTHEDYNQDKLILLEKMRTHLKEKEYNVVMLHIYDEMSFAEISSSLKVPLGTVLYRYNNAIKKLKEVMDV